MIRMKPFLRDVGIFSHFISIRMINVIIFIHSERGNIDDGDNDNINN